MSFDCGKKLELLQRPCTFTVKTEELHTETWTRIKHAGFFLEGWESCGDASMQKNCLKCELDSAWRNSFAAVDVRKEIFRETSSFNSVKKVRQHIYQYGSQELPNK